MSNNKSIDKRRRIIVAIGRRWALIFLIVEFISFSILGKGYFTLRNIQNIFVAGATIFLLATGETFVIITGGIDLSVGFVMGFSGIVMGKFIITFTGIGFSPGLSIILGIIITMIIGLIPGYINGILISRLNVPPFIATFSMYGIAYGFAEIISKNVPIKNLPYLASRIGNGYFFYILPGKIFSFFTKPSGLPRSEMKWLVELIPNVFVITFFFVLIFGFVLKYTKFGQHTYAIGGSIDAAIRSGINVKSHITKVYMISSFFATLGGIVYILKFVTGKADAGSARMLDSIVAVVIGGASLYGGIGTIGGSILGCLIISVLETGLIIMGVPTFNIYIAIGLILIFAVLMDQFFPELIHRED